MALLRVENLRVSFPGASPRSPRLVAVDGVSMSVEAGRTLAVVGESGCGKSITALATMGLLPKGARVDQGRILLRAAEPQFSELDLLKQDEVALRRVRGGQIAMIFQEPMTSLNPVFSVGEQIMEAIELHHEGSRLSRAQLRERTIDAMQAVGIERPARRVDQYPHQFSGGMRQRIMIAMALACRPRVLLADEPTTALDVTVQAQVLDLLDDLKRTRSMGVMLITHDLGVVARHADTVCVMYAGRVVERAAAQELFSRPLHPYTRALLACAPRLGARRDRLLSVRETVDDPSLAADLRVAAGADVRAWWLWHDAPPGVQGSPHVLREVTPGHWVGLWNTPEAQSLTPSAVAS